MLICKTGRAPVRTTSRVWPRLAASACRNAPYTNAESGLRLLGRAPRPSPCTRRVWVPPTVPRAACTPATLRRPRAVIGRRPHARRRPFSVLRPCRCPHQVWPQLGAQANTSTASSRPYKPSFSTCVSTQPAAARHRCRYCELHLRLPFFANACCF
jgi:hypothetical protein